jgi:hypothetical protein
MGNEGNWVVWGLLVGVVVVFFGCRVFGVGGLGGFGGGVVGGVGVGGVVWWCGGGVGVFWVCVGGYVVLLWLCLCCGVGFVGWCWWVCVR